MTSKTLKIIKGSHISFSTFTISNSTSIIQYIYYFKLEVQQILCCMHSSLSQKICFEGVTAYCTLYSYLKHKAGFNTYVQQKMKYNSSDEICFHSANKIPSSLFFAHFRNDQYKKEIELSTYRKCSQTRTSHHTDKINHKTYAQLQSTTASNSRNKVTISAKVQNNSIQVYEYPLFLFLHHHTV